MNEIVAYIRYSDHKQDDGFSIEYQTSEINEFAERNGYDIDKYYIDKAQTATKVAGREEFFAMVSAAKEKRIKVIIVYKLSRLFRNAYESGKYREIFRKHGIKLMSVTQAVDEDTSAGRLSTNIISSVDQYQSETISDHVKSSMREMARQGFYTGGHVRFGFDLQEIQNGSKKRKKFILHEVESEIVKRVFDMYCEGFSLGMIRKLLNDEGARSRQGKLFSNSFISRILQDDIYIGTLRFKTKDYDDIVAENVLPVIVDKELFEKANEIRLSKQNVTFPLPRQTSQLYGLTGKVVCAECGKHMTGFSTIHNRNGKKTQYLYYKCNGRKIYKQCKSKSVRKEFIEDAVLQAIKSNILNAERIKQIAEEVVSICYASPSDLTQKIKEKSREKTKLESRISKLMDAFIDGDISKEIAKRKIEEAETELKATSRLLYSLKDQEKNALTNEKVEAYLHDMLEKSNSKNDEVLKAVFDTFVQSILVSDDEIKITLNGFTEAFNKTGKNAEILSQKSIRRL